MPRPYNATETRANAGAAQQDAGPETDTLVHENMRLREELAFLRHALDAAKIGFMIIDVSRPERPITYVNNTLAQRAGYGKTELIGRPCSSLTQPQTNPELAARLESAIAAGLEIHAEIPSMRKDGSPYWSGVSMTPVTDHHKRITHYVSLSSDITEKVEAERKRAELVEKLDETMRERDRAELDLRLAQKLEAVGRLAAGVAHEINTPIQYVGDSVHFLQDACLDIHKVIHAYQTGLSEIAGGASAVSVKSEIDAVEKTCDLPFLTSEIPKAIDRTLEGIERVATIVRAMKEFSHPDAVDHEPADINHAIETTLVVARAEYKYIAVVETRLQELPPVICNIGELNQVFLNLLVNAAHAIAETGKDASTGRIVVVSVVDGNHIKITVQDNGCGIPEQNLHAVFDPFFTTKGVGKGTGQGLAITQSIVVAKHGGTVDVDSKVGVGTTFTLRLPIQGRPRKEITT